MNNWEKEYINILMLCIETDYQELKHMKRDLKKDKISKIKMQMVS